MLCLSGDRGDSYPYSRIVFDMGLKLRCGELISAIGQLA